MCAHNSECSSRAVDWIMSLKPAQGEHLVYGTGFVSPCLENGAPHP